MSYTLITGATGYLGKAFAWECAKRGDSLFLTGRSLEKLKQLMSELKRSFPDLNIVVYPCDLAIEQDRQQLFQMAENLTFSCLINVAGADIQKPFMDYTQEKVIFQTRVCFESAVSFCLFALKHRAQELSIINISSVSGLTPMPYFALYSATKDALTQFSIALRKEVEKSGVKVCAILPGAIYTRPDVKEYIATQGFWGKWAAKQPEFVARKSLLASKKDKVIYIPGFANRCIQFFAGVIPQKIKLKIIARRWSKTQKDAF